MLHCSRTTPSFTDTTGFRIQVEVLHAPDAVVATCLSPTTSHQDKRFATRSDDAKHLGQKCAVAGDMDSEQPPEEEARQDASGIQQQRKAEKLWEEAVLFLQNEECCGEEAFFPYPSLPTGFIQQIHTLYIARRVEPTAEIVCASPESEIATRTPSMALRRDKKRSRGASSDPFVAGREVSTSSCGKKARTETIRVPHEKEQSTPASCFGASVCSAERSSKSGAICGLLGVVWIPVHGVQQADLSACLNSSSSVPSPTSPSSLPEQVERCKEPLHPQTTVPLFPFSVSGAVEGYVQVLLIPVAFRQKGVARRLLEVCLRTRWVSSPGSLASTTKCNPRFASGASPTTPFPLRSPTTPHCTSSSSGEKMASVDRIRVVWRWRLHTMEPTPSSLNYLSHFLLGFRSTRSPPSGSSSSPGADPVRASSALSHQICSQVLKTSFSSELSSMEGMECAKNAMARRSDTAVEALQQPLRSLLNGTIQLYASFGFTVRRHLYQYYDHAADAVELTCDTKQLRFRQ